MHRSLSQGTDGKFWSSCFNSDPLDNEISNYPQGLVLVPRGTDDNSVVVGPHIRGSRLRASAAGDEEVDLLLPGTARYDFLKLLDVVILATPMDLFCFFFLRFWPPGVGAGYLLVAFKENYK